ncbi:hypothetical protein EDEG_01963 [Edhazardia aedis USNM 41457]|uniref:Derlin n=1 Tax=Edhazardia aedis (strain USNM 41457) TaxID=1003232 RepID=J8ZVS5_EDHAE|nr:hypothetical protein EDEG_01963 [Edhazardia aedis USNM 41457]|eukprot:EJW03768.1 hypothetical protein EDEG_01963 [Edhazardia aedis USNM 41457]
MKKVAISLIYTNIPNNFNTLFKKMDTYNQIPPATRTIITASVALPLIGFIMPNLSRYLYFSIYDLKRLKIHQLLTGIFIQQLDLNLFFRILSRYLVLMQLENNSFTLPGLKIAEELIFYTSTFAIPLFISNLFFRMFTFAPLLNTSYVTLQCFVFPKDYEVMFYGIKMNMLQFLVAYLVFEFLVSRGSFEFLVGFLYGLLYYFLRTKIKASHRYILICKGKLLNFCFFAKYKIESLLRQRRGRRLCDYNKRTKKND